MITFPDVDVVVDAQLPGAAVAVVGGCVVDVVSYSISRINCPVLGRELCPCACELSPERRTVAVETVNRQI